MLDNVFFRRRNRFLSQVQIDHTLDKGAVKGAKDLYELEIVWKGTKVFVF